MSLASSDTLGEERRGKGGLTNTWQLRQLSVSQSKSHLHKVLLCVSLRVRYLTMEESDPTLLYDNLMQFLDSYDAKEVRAATSKISAIGSTSSVVQKSSSSSPRKESLDSSYIWDYPEEYLRETYRKSSSPAPSPTIGSELKAKIQELKDAIKSNKEKAKELQAEFVRLSTVKSRRKERRQKLMDASLSEQENDQRAALKKQQDFMGKVRVDVATLEKKYSILSEKAEANVKEREHKLAMVHSSCKQKLARAMRQLEVEDKQSIDKVVHGKLDAMNKSAAELFGPKLDELVRQGREELSATLELHERSMHRLERELDCEREETLAALEVRLRQKAKLQVLKEKQEGQHRLSDLQQRCAAELLGIANAAEIERQRVQQAAERQRDRALSELDSTAQSTREMHGRALQEARQLNSDEAKAVAQQLFVEREGVRARLVAEKESWREKCLAVAQRGAVARREKLAAQLRAEVALEKERVLAALRIDIDQERRESSDAVERELAELRLQLDDVDGTDSSSSRARELAEETEELRLTLKRLHADDQEAVDEMTRLKAKTSQVLGLIAQVQSKLQALNSDEEDDKSIAELEALRARTMSEVTALQRDKARLLTDFEQTFSKEKEQCEVGLSQCITLDLCFYSYVLHRLI